MTRRRGGGDDEGITICRIVIIFSAGFPKRLGFLRTNFTARPLQAVAAVVEVAYIFAPSAVGGGGTRSDTTRGGGACT